MNLKINGPKEFLIILLITVLIVTIFSFVLFGMTGIRVVVGIALMTLPFYILLNSFKLTEGEKSVFSILLGLTLFPSLVYLLGLIIPFKIAIILTFILLLVVAFLITKIKKQK